MTDMPSRSPLSRRALLRGIAATLGTGAGGIGLSHLAAAAPVAQVQRGVVYTTTDDGTHLTLDLRFPTMTTTAPVPVAVYAHGGGLVKGMATVNRPEALALSARGYLVAAVNYRLMDAAPFPAQIVDVKTAVRFLRASAATYTLDPDRIVAWGDSAGGQLVSLLGLADASVGWDMGQYLDQSSAVRAVVDQFGPSDIAALASERTLVAPKLGAQLAQRYGTDMDLMRLASPVMYVRGDAPPFLIQQGERDQTVPPSQSQELYDRLTGAGAKATLTLVKNAGHEFQPQGGAIDPSRDALAQAVADFFDQYTR